MILGVLPALQSGGATLRLLLGLDLFPHALGHAGIARLLVAEDVRVAADHLPGDGFDHIAESKFTFFVSHLRVIDNLKQEVAEFLAQVVHVVAGDGIRHLVGFLDRVRRDGRKGLLDIPRAAGDRRAQRRHDFDEAGDVLGGLHGRMLARARQNGQCRYVALAVCPQSG